MLLVPDDDMLARRVAHVDRSIALRACCGPVDESDPWAWLNMLQFPQHWAGWDLTMTCTYRIHTILMSDRLLDFFIPGQVEVDLGTPPKRFWPGSRAALLAIASAHAKHERQAAARAGKERGEGVLVGLPAELPAPIPLHDTYAAALEFDDPNSDSGCGGDAEGGGIDVISCWADSLFDELANADEELDTLGL